jgi:hypothetical protein
VFKLSPAPLLPVNRCRTVCEKALSQYLIDSRASILS